MDLLDLLDGVLGDPYVSRDEKEEIKATVLRLIDRLGEIDRLAEDRQDEDHQ